MKSSPHLMKRLFETSRRIKSIDPAAKSLLEVIFFYPGVHALFFHRIAHFFYCLHLYFIARFFNYVSRAITGIDIHPGAQIGRRLFIDHGQGLVIGESAVVGDDCIIYHGVTLGGVSIPGQEDQRRHPKVGNDVLIGAHAQLIGGITIGDHARVGANAVVLADVPECTTVVDTYKGQIVLKPRENCLECMEKHRKLKEKL